MAEREQKPFNFDSEETKRILAALRSVVDKGGPSEPVVSGRRDSYIGPNTGARRLNRVNTEGMEPLAERDIFSLINRSPLGLLGDIADPVGSGSISPAGLPFAAYKSKGIKSLYHGTRQKFDKFDPSKYDVNDVLGHMTHTAENPDYAAKYAEGFVKPHYPESYSSRIIPIQPEAKNVLDLVDPNADDISQALAFAENKDDLINLFKRKRASFRGEPEHWLTREFRHPAHAQAPAKEHPIRKVAENLRLSPQTTENMPWDAIRYHDIDEKSWAFPARTPLYSQFGAPLTPESELIPLSPIRMVRDDAVSTGQFPSLYREPVRSKRLNPKYNNPNAVESVKELPNSMLPEGNSGYVIFDPVSKTSGFKYTADKLDEVLDIVEGTNLDYLPMNEYKSGLGEYTKPKSSIELNQEYAKSSLAPVSYGNLTTKNISFPTGTQKTLESKVNINEFLNTFGNKQEMINEIYNMNDNGLLTYNEMGLLLDKVHKHFEDIPKITKPKYPYVKPIYDIVTNQGLLQIGTKKFPQTTVGLGLAKMEIHNMVKNSVISPEEATEYFKQLKKYKPQGVK